MVDASRLSTCVTILQRTPGADGLGQPLNQWQPLQKIWADVRYQSGLASLAADKIQSRVRASFRVRQNSFTLGIEPGMRARVGGADYTIVACLPQGRDAIDLVCEAV